MKTAAIGLLMTFVLFGCKSKSALHDEDQKYVSTAADLVRTRARLSATSDSTAVDSNRVRLALDSVYHRHDVTRQQFIDWTLRLSDDPKRANAFFDALNDSIGKTK